MTDRARQHLSRFAQQARWLLDGERDRASQGHIPELDLDAAEHVLNGIDRFLKGEAPLEQALGLVRLGRPTGSGERKTVERMVDLRLAGKGYHAIGKETGREASDVKKALDRNQDAGNAHIVRRLRDEFTMRQAFGPKPGNAHIANELIMTRAFGPKVAPAGN